MPEELKAIVFDVFGTVVDWRGGVTRAVAAAGVFGDPARFADEWYAGYRPALDAVRSGVEPWAKLDILHRRNLDALLSRQRVTLDDAARQSLGRAWEQLDPWPDAVPGLARLKARFIIGTLTNGSVGQMVRLAKHGGLPWDITFTAELVRHYKPDPEAYRMVPDYLGLEPGQCMLVASHAYDLRSARQHGLRTAYVTRPLEYGPGPPHESVAEGEFDLLARDFLHLAGLLGA
ncbi:MAG TPA: haloacid dehalogenase type II [Stellaceae bacterium]|nr:haloacid dehalogenase type II [Stellaceae bacterium]